MAREKWRSWRDIFWKSGLPQPRALDVLSGDQLHSYHYSTQTDVGPTHHPVQWVAGALASGLHRLVCGAVSSLPLVPSSCTRRQQYCTCITARNSHYSSGRSFSVYPFFRMATTSVNCGWAMLRNILWTDKACFARVDVPSVNIVHLWGGGNCHAIPEQGCQGRYGVNVWVDVVGNIVCYLTVGTAQKCCIFLWSYCAGAAWRCACNCVVEVEVSARSGEFFQQ